MNLEAPQCQRTKIEDQGVDNLRRAWRRAGLHLLLFVLFFFFAACSSIRPIAKIGLIAPFEGLYRQSGYAALDAMRSAIGETGVGHVDLLPQALDGHGERERTRRAVSQVLADQRVEAVIGPLSPQMTAAVADLLSDGDREWIVPYAVDPEGGFADPVESEAWAVGLLEAVGKGAREQGAQQLVLAGAEEGWPLFSDDQWSEIAGMSVLRVDSPDQVAGDNALFWMGDSADGANFLNQLRTRQPDVPFWLGPTIATPVFFQRAEGIHQVYWSTWTDLEYTSWAANRSSASPNSYLIYLATDAVIGSINGEVKGSPTSGGRNWYVQLYATDEGGVFIPWP